MEWSAVLNVVYFRVSLIAVYKKILHIAGFSNEECIEKVLSDVKSVCGSSCAPPCK